MDDENLGYACGVLCGRGFSKHGRNNCVGLSTKNESLAREFASALRSVLGYDVPVKEKSVGAKRRFIVNAYGKDVVSVFDNMNFRPTRRDWSPPQQAYENREFRRGFLAGFFDATSYVYFNREKISVSGSGYRYVRATSANVAGLVRVGELLAKEGVGSSLRKSKNRACYLTVRGVWRLKTFAERIWLRTEKMGSVIASLPDRRGRI